MGYVSSLSSDVTSYISSTTSGKISFTGLGNGTDFQEIIEATVNAEAYRKDAYEADRDEKKAAITLLEELKSNLKELKQTLEDMGDFLSMDATSTGDQVSASASADADTGTHTVIVDQLAQNDVWIFTDQGYASSDTVVAQEATTLQLTYAGESIAVDIAAGTTLAGLINTINANAALDGKLSASLINDGSSYYFVLRGEESGAENAITVADTGSLSGWSAEGFTNTQEACNARLRVDGFPVGAQSWIERSSNTIDDVIKGVTLELMETTGDSGLRISVRLDTEAIVEKAEALVASVNQIIYDMQVLTGRAGSDDEDSETLTVRNSATNLMYSQFKSVLSSSGIGFARYDSQAGGDLFNALSQVGISTNTDEGSDSFGQLILDTDALEEALAKNSEAVALLFSTSGSATSDSNDFSVDSIVGALTPAGEHTVEYTVENGVLVSAFINGEAAAIEGDWNILGIASSSRGLSISILNQEEGTHTGTARVRQGKIDELIDTITAMTNSEDGTLTILIDNYEQSVSSLNNQIYNEEKRLDQLESSLTRKYAALDAKLIEYSALSNTLESLLASLSS
ncbi:flagellar filament capping protein FliD [Pseudodesulfovibrio sp. F-1]|uniref:Flagellar hook-associated protein 2 n=1 Tax=Pseudodesulfovibrio alkaliphilus TaxID=2661613 RepID=A0A7K1KL24_9BACT|nr:flagellar filament capping protein FliD [Pseudodesulfovibrio alkaliphilus]MUM76779.1 flagellar filament capping protein FliD [Pseudodesulfovibrio alkaliphilus]